jgi:hypothetical protein
MVLSVVNTATGRPGVYCDTAACFVLVTLGR